MLNVYTVNPCTILYSNKRYFKDTLQTGYFTAISDFLIAVKYHVNCMEYWASVYGNL